MLIDQKNVDGELIAGQKTRRPARTVDLLGALRGDLLEWRIRCGNPEAGLIFPTPSRSAWREHDWLNWNRRVWTPVARALGIDEPPYTLRHSFASLRIREGASIPELAEELGTLPPHDPQHVQSRHSRAARDADGVC